MSDSDKQQTIAALAALAQSCTAALARPAPPSTDEPLPAVLADIDGLLALVYALATKLSLALKPPAPAYTAAVPLLADLAGHVAALAHCQRLLRDPVHGAALVKDIRSHLAEIIEALRALAQTFLNNAARGPQLPGSAPSADECLIRTGALHDLIATARGPTGIPKDNRSAVHKCWKADADSLDDNLQEIAKLIRQAESPIDDPSHDDDDDDGWDDIGGAGTRLNEQELDRAKNVHSLLRLTTLLHKRISLDLLPLPSSAPVSAFDVLLTLSNQLLITSDDLVASLYAPQELPCVRQEVLQIANIASSLRSQVASLLLAVDSLSDQLTTLSIDDTTKPAKKRADRKWFDTCVDQVLRACNTVTESTNEPENTTKET